MITPTLETIRATKAPRKIIRGLADLAINGAPPAFDEPLHVGKPNIGDRARFLSLMNGALDRAWLSNNGPLVQELERRIEDYLGIRHCVCVCNGTIGLELAIRALDLNGEVIVPSYTFIATAHALQWLGIKPVFADIDPITHNLDPASVRRAVTQNTSAILGVHLWGRAAPHDALQVIADECELKLFYDAAHTFGASLGGKMIGNFGACEVFSFHATKFFNTIEGGAVVTNDDGLAESLRLMRDFGFAGPDNVVSSGTNGKMSEASAAMGLTNFESLDPFIEVNRRNHHTYSQTLGKIPGLSILPYSSNEHNNYQYIVLEIGPEFSANRNRLLEVFLAENILARKYFWPGCHRMTHYANNPIYAGVELANTDLVAERVIVLPTGIAVGETVIETIHAIAEALGNQSK